MKKLLIAALLASSSFSTVAHARDSFIGEYAGRCNDKKSQCWLNIDKKGNEYTLTFTASDKFDYDKVFCRVSGKFERGNINYDMQNMYPDGLTGEMQNSRFFLIEDAPGMVYLGGGLVGGFACGNENYLLMQSYEIVGE